jgi:hypothetical protein
VQVLRCETYRHLVALLEEPAVAKLIQHAHFITGDYLDALSDIPSPLRRIVALAKQDLSLEVEGLGAGLRILAQRGAAPSFDALVDQLASISQPSQFVAQIRNLVLDLPLPSFVPPASVGHAQRIDDINHIRRLGKQWKNCLSTYVDGVVQCRNAVYLWPDKKAPAICVVEWHGRLGWVLEDAKGPENIELAPNRFDEIRKAFAAAEIWRLSSIASLEMIARGAFRGRGRRHNGGHGPAREIIDQCEREEMYEEFDPAIP